ncbi:MAG: M23 family metallopeptidase [Bdellovibrio sp.]
MTFYLFNILNAVFLAFLTFLSYQPALATANDFTAKPILEGDNLLSILRRNGFSVSEREKVLASDVKLRQIFLTLDTRYLIKKTPNEIELRVYDSQTSDAFRIYKKNSSLIAHRYKPQYKITSERIEGRIFGGGSSIFGSVLSKVKSNWVASRFVDAYAFDLKNPKAITKGARYWFTVEKKYEYGQFVKYGEISRTFLQISGVAVQKKFVRTKDGGLFLNAQDLFEERPFYSPVGYLKIASRFNMHRLHPITGRLQPHLGVDFELPVGEPVYSPRTGIVTRYGNNRAAGNYIVLLHTDGIETYYDHLQKIDKKIRQGNRIFAGEKIATVGCTGYCTRAHLHFAIRKKGQMVDPLRFIKPYPSYMKENLENQVAKN